MKNKILLLSAVMALVSVCGAWADSTKKYLKLTDSEFVLNRWWNGTNSNTISEDGSTLTLYGSTGDNGYYGGQAGWNFTQAISTSDWDKLVIKLKNEGPAVLQIRVTDGTSEASHDFAVDADNYAEYTYDLSATYKDNDATKDQITSITSVYFWGYWGGGNTVDIDEIYFEKDGDEEPVTPVEPVIADDTKEIAISSLTQGEYSITGGTDYNYLVIVPAKSYVTGQEYWYNISDGTNSVAGWGFAYGAYQQKRVSVLSIKGRTMYDDWNESTKQSNDFVNALAASSIDLTNLTKIHVSKGWSTDLTTEHEVSAIYFTNEMPTYDNRYNFPIECYGQHSYDHLREATAAGTWGTVCLPYNAAICGAYAYEVTGVDNASNPQTLYLKQVYGLLKAGVPYVFKSNTDKSSDAEEGDVTFYKAGASTVGSPISNALVGTFTDETEVPDGMYILTDEGWKTNGEGVTNRVNANRAYLDLSKVGEVPEDVAAKCITMSIEGKTTGITTLKTEANDDAVYNLNGVRVSNPQKGIYIKNGKKFIVK